MGVSRRGRNGDGVDLEDKIESLDFWTLGVDIHIIRLGATLSDDPLTPSDLKLVSKLLR